MGRVALGMGGDEGVAGPLGEVGQVATGHQALAGGALVGDRVLEVPGVEEVVGDLSGCAVELGPLQHDRVAGVGPRAVVGGVRNDGGRMVAPVQQVCRGGVPPVDQLAVRMEGTELVEGVVGVAVDEQPIGIVESPHRWDDVEARIVRVVGRRRSSNRIQGQVLEVLSHDRMLAGPLLCAGIVHQWK